MADKPSGWLLAQLVCPRDGMPLEWSDSCDAECKGDQRHHYTAVEGVPVMLRDDVIQTHDIAWCSLEQAKAEHPPVVRGSDTASPVDWFVQRQLAATNGILYRWARPLTEYPIPPIRLAGRGRLLDVGSNWGRWSAAAARQEWTPVGLDVSLDAALAARRMFHDLGLPALDVVVGDARWLPFAPGTFDGVFSYSVLQHFSKPDARRAIAEMSRVLRPGGQALVQMANTYGLRCVYNRARKGFRGPRGFDVRYWSPSELQSTFSELVGPSSLEIDGFFGLGMQPSDAGILPGWARAALRASETMRATAGLIPWLANMADSLYVRSHRE